jgi:hypothetical protein
MFTGPFKYQHVPGHIDKILSWHQLSVVQQFNCVCNTTAKNAVQRAIMSGYFNSTAQLLPREDAAVVIWGNKITNDVSHPVCFHASKEIAKRTLPGIMKWP